MLLTFEQRSRATYLSLKYANNIRAFNIADISYSQISSVRRPSSDSYFRVEEDAV
jgi:hypothetical protein